MELGESDYNFIKENYLNTIGNLTLSGNNGKLGNKTFIEKRDLPNAGYKDSRLWLNKYLSTIEKWNVEELEKRLDHITERFLKIWKFPEVENDAEFGTKVVNIFEAENPNSKKLEHAIFFDKKIEVREVAKLYKEVFKQLFDLEPEKFLDTELGRKIGLTKAINNLRQPIQINDSYFIEANIDNKNKFDRIKAELTTFNFEDEFLSFLSF